MLSSLVTKRDKLQEELCGIEKQVYEFETSYLQDSSHFGNMLKGFEGFLSSSKNSSNLKRCRKLLPEDRVFSLSSVTSPTVSKRFPNQCDGRSYIGSGKGKGGSLPTNGQKKLKKGRTSGGPRDAN
ncbi:Chromatin modification-related protein MEAF6 [Linum perenne]